MRSARAWIGAGLLGLLPLLAGADPGEDREAFLQGNRLYESGDYAGAVDAYAGILARGSTAPELEYNLGNAHLKAGRIGRAVLHFRRALELRPGYENALENLTYARMLTQDVKTAETGEGSLGWVTGIRLGPGPVALGVFLSTTVWLGFGLWRFYRGRIPGWAVATQWVSAAGALLLIGALLFEWGQLEGRHEGVVIAAEVDVRSGPSPEQTLSFRLHEGTEVEILRAVPGWTEIRVSPELQGWIPSSGLEEI